MPKLMDAIRSLKIAKLSSGNNLEGIIENGMVRKSGNNKRPYEAFYYRNITAIEDKYCDFNFELLPRQITSECIWDTDKNDVNKWGGRNETDVSNCISLISRVNNLLCTEEYNKIFGFRKSALNAPKDLIHVIDDYIKNKKGILRFDFSNVSFDYQVREILVNAIGKYLLNNAREGKFKNDPVVIFIDEAHQFLNKSIKDEYFDAKPLDSFELISKEARKYGLFLCIATQMPRDIPLGTLSQMGTFIVHRLINDQDKKAIESAASSANKNILSFLPILGEGEALLVGVDFPMPLLIKIDAPNTKPNSQTPRFTIKDK
ncbi:ATP-binding protein [Bacteroides xylanisolvens]|uniref:ATP-binding protein n=1 Tax=Bacteroides xylanisolvens TaxID=371601 RepID=UPI0039B674B7